MTLDNLIDKTLEKISPNSDAIKRLLRAAERNISDSKIEVLSSENRFDVAYKAIMQIANAGLQANGYRTLTSKPGHHQTMIQLLPQTLGIDKNTVIVLDAMRKQRNVADYSGDIIPENTVKICIAQAEDLLKNFKLWLSIHWKI
ncbi:MAG: DNA-binding protein [Legionellaceae bacterium]|nr:DNA-binding protein [Legionellaceae bacterium]MBP9775180.1 DNA-binding protein [Legionellaceae bacterium]